MEELEFYEERFQVRDMDADCGGWMRMSALLRNAQQLASNHGLRFGLTDDFYKREQLAYLLAKQSVEFLRVPRRAEWLTLISLPERSRRGSNKRITLVKDEAGQLVATVDSRWMLVDTSDGHIVRYPPEMLEAHWNERIPQELPQTMYKAEQLQPAGERAASYSLCDINRHLNNTCYLDVACDALPLSAVAEKPFRCCVVRYHREIPMGETVSLEYGPAAGGWYVVGHREGHSSFEVWLGDEWKNADEK